MRGLVLFGAAACALTALGCGDAEDAHSGAAEPFRVANGQFFEGQFPSADGGPAIDGPDSVRSSVVQAGFTGKKIGGLTAESSLSVALALDGLGDGYWVVPVGAPDPQTKQLTWQAICDFGREIPKGTQTLKLAAADRAGRFGKFVGLRLTMLPFVPEGRVVASLEWGNDADLDLHLIGPSGKELDPKHPNTALLGADGAEASGSGTLDHDSNAGCVPDGYRSEHVVWASDTSEPPEPGTYVVRADLFNACGRPATDFVFRLYRDGKLDIEQAGRLLDSQADGGGPGSGLFVTEFEILKGTE